jgi:hypothetical protein
MDAQCAFHRGPGPKCHIHRVLGKDPLGYLCAWLLSGCQECYNTRATHFAARADRSPDGPLSYARRVAARELAATQPLMAEFVLLELEHGTGVEPLEL